MFVQYKKDGKRARPLVDLTERNKIRLKDDEPIPNQMTILNDMTRARYRSKIDLSDAYFQTRVEPEDVWKNSFKSPFGGFVSELMLQGYMNAPGIFMHIMSHLMADFLRKFIWAYLDHILIFSDTEKDHLKHIAAICKKLKGALFYASRKKSKFFASRIEVLGHIIDDEGLKPNPEKIAKIKAWTTPTTKRQLQEFLGVVNYISKFLQHIATLTAPLTALTGTVEFLWTALHDAAMTNIKKLIAGPRIMKPVDYKSGVPIWLITDASLSGCGAWVGQGDTPETARPAALYSRKFTDPQHHYGTTDKEVLAIIDALSALDHILRDVVFTIVTDHQPLTCLKGANELSGRRIHWGNLISTYTAKIVYRPGNWNYLADALSRLYEEPDNNPHYTKDPTEEDENDTTPIYALFSRPQDIQVMSHYEPLPVFGHSECGLDCSLNEATERDDMELEEDLTGGLPPITEAPRVPTTT